MHTPLCRRVCVSWRRAWTPRLIPFLFLPLPPPLPCLLPHVPAHQAFTDAITGLAAMRKTVKTAMSGEPDGKKGKKGKKGK